MFLTFSESRDIIRSFNFKSQNEFTKWIKGKSKEHKIPTNPNKYYKNEWISWNDWLNNARTTTYVQNMMENYTINHF